MLGGLFDSLGDEYTFEESEPEQTAAGAGRSRSRLRSKGKSGNDIDPTRLTTITGAIYKFTFQKPGGDFVIAKFETERGTRITVKGDIPAARLGEMLELTGEVVDDPQWGQQFQIVHAVAAIPKLPTSRVGLEKWLERKVPGVGPVTVRNIFLTFGDQTFEILNNAPDRLIEVPKMAQAQVDKIKEMWQADYSTTELGRRSQVALRNLVIFVYGCGLGAAVANRAAAAWGDRALEVIKENPYRMVELDGVGFHTADVIALKQGYARTSPERIQAGVLHILAEASQEGHCYLPYVFLVEGAVNLLGLGEEQSGGTVEVTRTIGWMVESGLLVARSIAELVSYDVMPTPDPDQVFWQQPGMKAEMLRETTAIYSPRMDRAEGGVVQELHRLGLDSFEKENYRAADRMNGIRELLGSAADPVTLIRLRLIQSNFSLNNLQIQGVLNALMFRVSLITGGPGTGKTTSMRSLLEILRPYGYNVALVAPTGRAAKRLKMICQQDQGGDNPNIEAGTIHRILGMQGGDGEAKYDRENPLPFDFVIVDEASMCDIFILGRLLRAMPTGAHLLLVGDADQLPSVGPGRCLADLIEAGKFPITRLQQVYRQSADSFIVANAASIRAGNWPTTEGTSDFFFVEEDEPEKIAAKIVDLVSVEIPEQFGFQAQDVQVLVPMKAGPCGVDNLNKLLQARLNPPVTTPFGYYEQMEVGSQAFRSADYVMNLKNNYKKGVFNGDAGWVIEIDQANRRILVEMEDESLTGEQGEQIEFEGAEIEQLQLAYACTIHKSQGSEYPAVVIPLTTQHYRMLQRTLLYTAVTRGKKLVFLVGSRKALAMALANNKSRKRFTSLKERLLSLEPLIS